MERDYLKEAGIFKAFCDDKRLRILELLQDGEKCTCVLNEKLDVPQSTLSYHMKILCESGVVEGRQEGKWTHYSISKEGILCAMDILRAYSLQSAKRQMSMDCCL